MLHIAVTHLSVHTLIVLELRSLIDAVVPIVECLKLEVELAPATSMAPRRLFNIFSFLLGAKQLTEIQVELRLSFLLLNCGCEDLLELRSLHTR
jgi:hypothetical protein